MILDSQLAEKGSHNDILLFPVLYLSRAAQRRAGRATNGRARLGYRLLPGGSLRPDGRQRRIHRSIALLRDRGWQLREIAEQLNRTARRRPGARC